jgi:hypothetical protein
LRQTGAAIQFQQRDAKIYADKVKVTDNAFHGLIRAFSVLITPQNLGRDTICVKHHNFF